MAVLVREGYSLRERQPRVLGNDDAGDSDDDGSGRKRKKDKHWEEKKKAWLDKKPCCEWCKTAATYFEDRMDEIVEENRMLIDKWNKQFPYNKIQSARKTWASFYDRVRKLGVDPDATNVEPAPPPKRMRPEEFDERFEEEMYGEAPNIAARLDFLLERLESKVLSEEEQKQMQQFRKPGAFARDDEAESYQRSKEYKALLNKTINGLKPKEKKRYKEIMENRERHWLHVDWQRLPVIYYLDPNTHKYVVDYELISPEIRQVLYDEGVHIPLGMVLKKPPKKQTGYKPWKLTERQQDAKISELETALPFVTGNMPTTKGLHIPFRMGTRPGALSDEEMKQLRDDELKMRYDDLMRQITALYVDPSERRKAMEKFNEIYQEIISQTNDEEQEAAEALEKAEEDGDEPLQEQLKDKLAKLAKARSKRGFKTALETVERDLYPYFNRQNIFDLEHPNMNYSEEAVFRRQMIDIGNGFLVGMAGTEDHELVKEIAIQEIEEKLGLSPEQIAHYTNMPLAKFTATMRDWAQAN